LQVPLHDVKLHHAVGYRRPGGEGDPPLPGDLIQVTDALTGKAVSISGGSLSYALLHFYRKRHCFCNSPICNVSRSSYIYLDFVCALFQSFLDSHLTGRRNFDLLSGFFVICLDLIRHITLSIIYSKNLAGSDFLSFAVLRYYLPSLPVL